MSGKIITSNETVEQSKVPIQQLLIDCLKKHGTRTHLIEYESGGQFTFKNLYDDCLKLAFSMKTTLKVNPGDRLLICGYNSYECLCALVAGLVAGAIVTTMKCIDSCHEVFNVITTNDVKHFFITEEKRETFLNRKQEMPSVKNIVIINNSEDTDETKQYFTLKSLIRDAERPLSEDEIYDPKGNKDAIAMLVESSGSTGPAKRVLYGQYDLVTYLCQIREILHPNENDVICVNTFISHLSGLTLHLLSVIYGMRIVTFKTASVEKTVTAISLYKITWVLFSPSYLNLVNQCQHSLSQSSLTHVFVGGSRVAKQNVETFLNKYPCKLFINWYAMSELMFPITIAINCNNKETIGKVAPGTQIKVIDTKTGVIYGANKHGEICVKGPIKFKGYHKNEDATKAVLDSEGWFHTADIGYFDNDENFYIVDRIKDIITKHGFHYSPVDVEDVLLQHEAVKEAAVVGVPVGYDEVSHAFIVLKDEFKTNKPNGKEILDFVNERVSEIRILETVHFMDQIPKTEFGKVLRRQLREEFSNSQQSKE